jgi:hypothetical protein
LSKTTKIIGWIVLAITEILIIWAFAVSDNKDMASLISSQIIVFGIVWGSVNVKNVIDLKRDTRQFMPNSTPTNRGILG